MVDEDDGAEALEQLAEIRRTRQRLDEEELAAVRAARRGGRSWAEIATMLGVSRQSAWERWNDLDEVIGSAAAALTAAAESAPPASSARRRATVKVPDLISMTFAQASRRLDGLGLQGDAADVDPARRGELPSLLVRSQAPEAGARVPAGATVRLWLRGEGGGGAGVREPRRPAPRSGAGKLMRAVDEAS